MLWRSEEHERLTERAWDAEAARRAIRTIVSDAESAERDSVWPAHPLDEVEGAEAQSLYLGSAGMIWALSRLGSGIDARAAIGVAIERYRATAGPEMHGPSLLVGESGLLLVADRVGSPAADRERLRELVRANREHPAWDLVYGSPGTMLAARACGLDEEWSESAAALWSHRDEATGLWTQELGGVRARYIGAGHGFAGNVRALRSYIAEDVLRDCVAELLERTAIHADGLVNWPPIDDPLRDLPAMIRVQWCHGAPGIVTMLGDLMACELASDAGELVWRAGPLRKGPGLCHGTAGNGYAFLRLYELTADRGWLERARRFAMHAIEQVAHFRGEYGQGRYSLWTGDIGVAIYLDACIHARAGFPTVDVF